MQIITTWKNNVFFHKKSKNKDSFLYSDSVYMTYGVDLERLGGIVSWLSEPA